MCRSEHPDYPPTRVYSFKHHPPHPASAQNAPGWRPRPTRTCLFVRPRPGSPLAAGRALFERAPRLRSADFCRDVAAQSLVVVSTRPPRAGRNDRDGLSGALPPLVPPRAPPPDTPVYRHPGFAARLQSRGRAAHSGVVEQRVGTPARKHPF